MLQDGAPAGASFDFEGTGYLITPRIASGKTVRIVKKLIAEQEQAKALWLLQTGLLSKEAQGELVREMVGNTLYPANDMQKAVRDPDILPFVLAEAIDDMTAERAEEIVSRGNMLDLSTTAIMAMDMDSLKNLRALIEALNLSDQGAEVTEQTEENQETPSS